MPAIPFVSFDSPVDGVRRLYNKRQLGVSAPAPRVGLPMAIPGSQPEAISVESNPLLLEIGDSDDDDSNTDEPNSPTNIVGLPTAPVTVTLVNTLTSLDATPTPSISVSADPSSSTIPTIIPGPPSSDLPVSQPSASVVESSVPIPQPSDVIVQPSNVIQSDNPQPSIPLNPAPSPPPSQPSEVLASIVPSSPSAPMASSGGVMLSDNQSPPSVSGGLAKSNKLSAGAIVGIIIAIAAVLLLAGIFLFRKTVIRRRRQRNFGNNLHWPDEKLGKQGQGTVTPYPFTAPVSVGAPRTRQHQPQLSIARIPPPPITPSIAPPHFSSTAAQPPLPVPTQNGGVISPDHAPLGIHTVKSTFITTLSDELNIKMGEKIRVLTVYDDGWALCEKLTSGEQGMAPMECLVADEGTFGATLGRTGSLRNVV